jgi:hypothetical protein
VRIEELRRNAVERARALPRVGAEERERFRHDARELFNRVPEPPVYRRRDDPVRARAAELLQAGEGLLARAYALEADDELAPWRAALDAHLEALCLVVEGRVERANDRWQQAIDLERKATASSRLWARSDAGLPPVFDRQSRVSRYDSRTEALVATKLPCPSCRKVGSYSFSCTHATHQPRCPTCSALFGLYLAEVRAVEVTKSGRGRRYVFRLEELSGLQTRLEVNDSASDELRVAPRELVAFLYLPPTVLRGVLNLDSSRVLWLSSGGPCFVATVSLGVEAPQLEVFRAFRDRVMRRSAAGRGLISAYYAHGPRLARIVVARPWLMAVVGRGLGAVARRLERSRW